MTGYLDTTIVSPAPLAKCQGSGVMTYPHVLEKTITRLLESDDPAPVGMSTCPTGRQSREFRHRTLGKRRSLSPIVYQISLGKCYRTARLQQEIIVR